MCCFIVVAAGSGSRYGGALPKQFCDLNGRPLLMTTLERLHLARPQARIILVVSDQMEGRWLQMCHAHQFTVPVEIAHGGATRTDSVANALKMCTGEERWIAVHDGARPLVTREMIDRLELALDSGSCQAAIPVVEVTDSLRKVGPDGQSQPVDRAYYRAVQTPQMCLGDALLKAYHQAGESATDDATLVQNAGYRVAMVPGDPRNIKVTVPGDIKRVVDALQQF